jgi:hypothetical protein
MAVAEVIETRAYFRRKRPGHSKASLPQRQRRFQTPRQMDDDPPMVPAEEFGRPLRDPSLVPAPTQEPVPPARNPVIPSIAHEALSAPWMGPVNLHYRDDDPETSDQATPGDSEPESSDADSETDDDEVGLGGFSDRGLPDIFETDADLNAAEYSQCSHFRNLGIDAYRYYYCMQHLMTSVQTILTCCASSRCGLMIQLSPTNFS